MDYPKPTHQIVKTDLFGEKIAVISNLWGQQEADLAWEYYQAAVNNDSFDYQLIKL